MGVAITELVPTNELDIRTLNGKIIAVDASLFLYQFITTIRQRDGTPLKDSKGNITSHLTGLFSRNLNLMQKGMKLVYVFDGKVPELKRKERERRNKLKEEAQIKYDEAVKSENVEAMRKYASRTVRLTSSMVVEAKELLDAMGIPIVEAPSEAEAQASHMVRRGDAYAVATQDADVLMFGATNVVKNLSILGKRKKINAMAFKTVKPELIILEDVLNTLGLDRDQLIALCMLIGTDYNIGGIKGIGPKNAIKNVKKYGKDFEEMFASLKWDEYFDYPWTDVFYQIKKIPVSDEYDLKWGRVNESKLNEILVDRHDFSRERIISGLDKIKSIEDAKKQTSLFDF